MIAQLRKHNESNIRQPQRDSRPRILFIGEAVSLAHVARPAVLAQWTSAAGYNCHLACGDAFASAAIGAGITPRPLKTIDAATFYARLNAGKFFYTLPELDAYVRAELELIEEIQPDLIVGDFRLTLDISAALAGIPLVSLNNAHWSPASACAFPAPNAGLFRILPSRVRNRLFSFIRPLAFRTFARSVDDLRQRYGMPALNDFRRHYTAGKYCAYLDLPELSTVTAPPQGHFFLGPVAWEPRNLPTLRPFRS